MSLNKKQRAALHKSHTPSLRDMPIEKQLEFLNTQAEGFAHEFKKLKTVIEDKDAYISRCFSIIRKLRRKRNDN